MDDDPRSNSPSPVIVGVRGLCMAAAVVALLTAIWSGLARMGLVLGAQPPGWLVQAHGPIMLNGFFGTLISLERAVAYGRLPGYAAPVLVAAGVLAATTVAPAIGPWLTVVGSLGVVALFAIHTYRQPAIHHVVMGAGALAWAGSNTLWALDWPFFRIIGLWSLFLVWTIAGERLELSRVLGQSRQRIAALSAAIVLGGAGIGLDLAGLSVGARLLGVSFTGIALWLVVFDVARRTARAHGLTAYIGRVLVSGYLWLAVGGLLLVVFGNPLAGPAYDAVWHATLVGFVLTMIFAHAPVVLPALTSRRVRFRAALYLPAVVLHTSLIVRLVGDLTGRPPWRIVGGAGNAAAILLFAAIILASLD